MINSKDLIEPRAFRSIAIIGIGLYVLSLAIISIAFRHYALKPLWMIWGIGEVLVFFTLSWFFGAVWPDGSEKAFRRKLFWTALGIRALYAFLMCYYYYYQTGIPFEYDAADSLMYHRTSLYFSRLLRHGELATLYHELITDTMGFSDRGYEIWLTLIYAVFGRNILVPRLFKALMSAYMCVAVYKLASRTFDERAGRLSGVFCLFMPVFIYYVGVHLKETELVFLTVLALERMDYLIRSRKYTFWNIFLPILLTAFTFGLRTIVGMCLLFAFFVFVLLSDSLLVSRKKKIALILSTAVVFLLFLFTPIGKEMRIVYRLKFTDLTYHKEQFQQKGMKHAELVQSKYLAPGIFVLPLTSMVEPANNNKKMMNGGHYVKNYLAFFALFAIVLAFRQREWRGFSLVGAFTLSYLLIIAFSFAVNIERYHLPTLPLLLVMGAYAMVNLQKRDLKFFYAYCVVLLVAIFMANYLKLSSSSLV